MGIYVDAFNVYYGGRSLVAGGPAGASWKWLDLGGLCDALIDRALWPDAHVARLVYCSAPRSATGDVLGSQDQRRYFDALRYRAGDEGYDFLLELGYYVHTEKSGLLLTGRREPPIPWAHVLEERELPSWLALRPKHHVDGSVYALGSFRTFEEKGTDVNVATHLTADVCGGTIDAAVVVSNDSDLALPVSLARMVVPVGHVNPSARPTAGRLRGLPGDGAGRHWWRRLAIGDFVSHQLPSPCGGVERPDDW